MLFLSLWSLAPPLAFAGFAIAVFLKGNRPAAGAGALCFALSFAAGVWAILQSRSSTAGIGFLFLPAFATIVGLLGLGFGVLRASATAAGRAFGWVLATLVAITVATQVVGGLHTAHRNASRDADNAAAERRVEQNRASIAAMLARNNGGESAALDREIRARMTDRTYLIPALESEFVSPALLDTLAGSPDLGIALQAVRNPSTPATTIEHVYRTHVDPDYFVQAIAAHPHAPAAVLREIYTRPRTSAGLEVAFAGNRATPPDILDEIAATTKDLNVLQRLVANPALGPSARRHVEHVLQER